MKKLFISQPMRDRSDEEILEDRKNKKATKLLKSCDPVTVCLPPINAAFSCNALCLIL